MDTRIRVPVVSVGLAAIAFALAPPVAAQVTVAESPARHDVRRGDTLWDLAARYLADPFLWPEIFRLNADVVEDPDLIFPGESLRIPGRTALAADASAVRAARIPPSGAARRGGAGTDLSGTVFASRDQGLAASRLSESETVPSALVSESDHFRVGLLIDPAELGDTGRTVRVVEETILTLDLPKTVRRNQEVVIATDGLRPEIGDRLRAVRWERDVAGRRVLSARALLEVVRAGEDSVRARVTDLYAVYEVGDPVIAAEPFSIDPAARPEPADDGLTGRILAFETPQPLLDLDDPVFLDVGRSDGVRLGDEFLAFARDEKSPGTADPRDALSRLRVVRTTETTSTALVVSIRDPATAEGAPIRRIARLPG
jgi:LysM repeat protein